MKNKGVFLTAILTAVLCFSGNLWAYSGGTGDPNNPYQIANVTDFNQLTLDPNNWNKAFVLTADINLAGQIFTKAPIAPDISTTYDFQGTQFTGIFDGNSHTISNLTITASTKDYVSLFGYVSSGGQIRNLGAEDVNLTGRHDVGGLVGYNYSGTLTNCYATGSVTGLGTAAGGLVGVNFYSGTLTSCYATGSVGAGNYVGGLVGQNLGPLTSCYATGSVTGMGGDAGGLVGYEGNSYTAKIEKCYSTGQITGSGSFKGGLIGFRNGNAGIVTACFWDINTSGLATSAGGSGVQGKTTVQMKTLSTFTSAGWDFTNETVNGPNDIWRMCVDGADYPRLNWQSIDGDIACPDGVNFVDYVCFATRWLAADCSSANNYCGGTDMDFSGTVDMKDFVIFADNWLKGI